MSDAPRTTLYPIQISPESAPDQAFSERVIAEGGPLMVREVGENGENTTIWNDRWQVELGGRNWAPAKLWEVLRVFVELHDRHKDYGAAAAASDLRELVADPTSDPQPIEFPEVADDVGEQLATCFRLRLSYIVTNVTPLLAGTWTQAEARAAAEVIRLGAVLGHRRGREDFGRKVRRLLGA